MQHPLLWLYHVERVNALTSHGVTAILSNAPMPVGSNFDATAQTKYGITLGTKTTGQAFIYKYMATSTQITITVSVEGYADLLANPHPIAIILSPSPSINTIEARANKVQADLDIKQERVNALTSHGAIATQTNACR